MHPDETQIEAFQLSEELLTGLEELDTQHRYFLALTNALRDAGKDKELLSRLMLDIARYAQCHFAYEENLMLAYQYPERQQHIDEHQKILDALKTATTDGLNLPQARLQMIEWLLSHIPLDDKPLAQFVIAHRPSVAMKIPKRVKAR
jgi:hemerythrin-like metal-binding protein